MGRLHYQLKATGYTATTSSDTERVAFLFELYLKYTNLPQATSRKKRRSTKAK